MGFNLAGDPKANTVLDDQFTPRIALLLDQQSS
jgi:hypothetical protein